MKKRPLKNLVKALCLWCIGIAIQCPSSAQCIPSSLQSISYDTLIAGSGNDSHTFNFKKFNPALGTLVAAKVSSVVSVNYGFTLKNVESVTRDFSVSVGRYDNFQSPEISTPYNNEFEIPLGNYNLGPGASISHPLSTIIYRYLNLDSVVSDMANLMGAGSVSFSYQPVTYTNLLGSVNYYYSASAADTIHFTISYLYCNATVLPSKLTGFTAARDNNSLVKLQWTAVNEQFGNKYEVEESDDGIHFSTVGSLAATPDANGAGSYAYNYQLKGNEPVKIYYRLKMTDVSGSEQYSEIREVDLGEDPGIEIMVYPNPANEFINLSFKQPTAKNWQVEIYASTGSLVFRNLYTNCRTTRIDFIKKLAAGVYCVRATDQDGQKAYTAKFMVR